ncbi:glycosyltransferase [Marinobacter sp.]|uniref:glycosyltransferase n=1 Tax=Marinobacter sp. TaxID=50741 RepID=UPI003A9575D2
MDSKFISVIVPAHNEDKYISQCLESLSTQDYPKSLYEIIVVDNNSADKTSEIAANFDVKILQQSTGPVGAVRNAGAKLANGELLAFIDADCVAPKYWLAEGIEALSVDNSVYGGGCNIKSPPHWIEKAWLLENKAPPKELLGCCIFIKKADFFNVGGFDEKVTSGEDTKLSVMLKDQGYAVKMTRKLNVIHLGNPKTLKQFFLRQIWHSENYIQNWADTKTDPTFYLLIFFSVSSTAFVLNALLKNTSEALFLLAISLAVPMIFTLKRLRRSKNPVSNLRNLPAIYFLDFVYLSARFFGLLRSLKKTI